VIERLAAGLITLFARLVTAVRPEWGTHLPNRRPRVYFANHTSNGDFVLIWTVLPPAVRHNTRPVAAADYWLRSAIRRFIGKRVFKAVLIDRIPENRTEDPIQQMSEALDKGSGLILFPEGMRNLTEEPLLPFKSGLYRLARARPGVELVPVWIANLNRALPKGELLPVPILCTVSFGMPVRLREGEEKTAFLERARSALLALRPREGAR
jgi:1-acyl-sn-glycerol-3-phosphate acyltransferase